MSADSALLESIQADWALQDGLMEDGQFQIGAVERSIVESGDRANDLLAEFNSLVAENAPRHDTRWIDLYYRAGKLRRAVRLEASLDKIRHVVFTKHDTLGGSHYAYTEALSDAQSERNFSPGSALCLLEMDGFYAKTITLIDDPAGVIRDPDVSWDGQRILFAWKQSDRLDDYHLYEMDIQTRAVRQLTFGLGFADYEPAYLPNGDILFNSTRCVQTVDCWWTEVSNLYTCDEDGKYLRRLSHDQVHTNYPKVTSDGHVIYTRWDYSDRGQIFPQGLFQMNPDGTYQTEFYGNNSWFPTTILHARTIGKTSKIVAIFTGHHTYQHGQLGILDPARGRQENQGAQLIAPLRETIAERMDAYGQDGPQFQYPYPLGETTFLVAMNPDPHGNSQAPHSFAIYWIDIDGRRELLIADPEISCSQPIPLSSRPRPPVLPRTVDYREETGIYYMQDIYTGPGLTGIPRGTIKKLRVVAIDFRAAGIGSNESYGPAGDSLSSTPVSIGNGCWDPKTILGDAIVHDDGSACFEVPSKTPVYFQALDAAGYAVQTMRSWSTLQPGEISSCVGCHESKNTAPLARNVPTIAMAHGPQTLAPFHGPPRGFSFAQEIQPILDTHCIRCHSNSTPDLSAPARQNPDKAAFSLLGRTVPDFQAKRRWSEAYLALTESTPKLDGGAYQGNPNGRWIRWISAQSEPNMLPPYHAGAYRSPLMQLLDAGHEGVALNPEEKEKIAAWIDLLVPFCGNYTEGHLWSEDEFRLYEHFFKKRQRMQIIEQQNIRDLLAQ